MNLEHLVKEARSGNDEAFYQLMRLHKDKLYKVAYAFLRNETDALEAIQEATCRAYLKLSQVKHPAYVSTWLTRIVIHICTDEQRRKKRLILRSTQPETGAGEIIGESDQAAIRLHLEEALAKLAPLYRHVVILKYFEDLTIREIATVLGQPEGTIKTWLHKGLNMLRHYLGKEW